MKKYDDNPVVVVDGEREEDEIVGEDVHVLCVLWCDRVETSTENGTTQISLEWIHQQIVLFTWSSINEAQVRIDNLYKGVLQMWNCYKE